MNWNDPYLIVRPEGAELVVLNNFGTLREARYYLQNLAEPMDAIFITPTHEHYKGDGTPTYNCHNLGKGKMDFHEEAWGKHLGISAPYQIINSKDSKQKSPSRNKDTQVIDLSNRNVKSEELEARFNINSHDLNLLFSDSVHWDKWNSLLTEKSNNVYVISVRADSASPLTLRISSTRDLITDKFQSDLRFIVKPIAAF